MRALLSVTDLRVSFAPRDEGAPAVDGISLEVRAGEAVGLVGESGCGKTATALSILGLLPPPGRVLPGSSIRFRDEELVGAVARLRRVRGREIAMVFQDPGSALNPVLPVGEQIAEALRHHMGLDRRAARERTAALLSEVGLPDPRRQAAEHPHRLSGGMRQRVVLAMALACEPALLVADEPTAALDVTIQAQILELLAELRERRGLAVLLISHDLGVVAEVCHRVAVMYAGRLVEVGDVADVFGGPAHPYTRGLLDSLPRVADPRAPLRPIAGMVPAPGHRPPGCRFSDRCPRAWERCRREPPLLPVAPEDSGRLGRCWLVDTGELPVAAAGDGRGP